MKLIILQGLISSGKSTKAAELVAQGNTVRINKDSLRTILHCDIFTPRLEGLTRDASRILAKTFLEKGLRVVIDDTNLNPKTFQSWKELGTEMGANIEIIKIDTPLDECITRDCLREKKVGKSVIVGMAMQFEMYPTPLKGICISDLDGTIANIDHRLKYVSGDKKDWKSFFETLIFVSPRTDVINKLNNLVNEGYEIFFVSGRPDNYRKQTETWLKENIPFEYKALFMRRSGDRRQDYETKSEIFKTYFKNPDWIKYVLDDRPQILINCWIPLLGKEKVIDVGNNKYFLEERKKYNYYTN
jgi:predicted kinase